MVKVSDDLKTARARLAVPGVWAQGDSVKEPSRLCLLVATDGLLCEHEADSLLKRALGMSVYGAFDWNDTPGRTLDEVLAVYDKAIAIAEKEEADETRT